MQTLRGQLVKAGFGGFVTLQSPEQKRRELLRLGLVRVLQPIKQQRLHLGLERTKGGLTVCREVYERRVSG